MFLESIFSQWKIKNKLKLFHTQKKQKINNQTLTNKIVSIFFVCPPLILNVPHQHAPALSSKFIHLNRYYDFRFSSVAISTGKKRAVQSTLSFSCSYFLRAINSTALEIIPEYGRQQQQSYSINFVKVLQQVKWTFSKGRKEKRKTIEKTWFSYIRWCGIQGK